MKKKISTENHRKFIELPVNQRGIYASYLMQLYRIKKYNESNKIKIEEKCYKISEKKKCS